MRSQATSEPFICLHLPFFTWQIGSGDQAVAAFESLKEVVKQCSGSSGESWPFQDAMRTTTGTMGRLVPHCHPISSLLFTGQMEMQADPSGASQLKMDSLMGLPITWIVDSS